MLQLVIAAAIVAPQGLAQKADVFQLNSLSAQEKAEGFVLLFDGKDTSKWRGWKKHHLPTRWAPVDNTLTLVRGDGEGGDIVSTEQYANFDFRFEWKIQEGGNSGVFYRVSEKFQMPWATGPEYQVLDDAKHADGKNPITSAASNYGLMARTSNPVRPADTWNEGRIVARGTHIEHWLNGEKVVEYVVESQAWKDLVAKSKFQTLPHYGREQSGHLVLQDHGDRVSYRNLRIKRL